MRYVTRNLYLFCHKSQIVIVAKACLSEDPGQRWGGPHSGVIMEESHVGLWKTALHVTSGTIANIRVVARIT